MDHGVSLEDRKHNEDIQQLAGIAYTMDTTWEALTVLSLTMKRRQQLN